MLLKVMTISLILFVMTNSFPVQLVQSGLVAFHENLN